VSVRSAILCLTCLALAACGPTPEDEVTELVEQLELDRQWNQFCGTISLGLLASIMQHGPAAIPVLEREAPGSPAEELLRGALETLRAHAAGAAGHVPGDTAGCPTCRVFPSVPDAPAPGDR